MTIQSALIGALFTATFVTQTGAPHWAYKGEPDHWGDMEPLNGRKIEEK